MSEQQFVVCDECNGMGEWDEGPINTGGPAPVDPEYRAVKCPQCDGTGRMEIEVEPMTLEDALELDQQKLDALIAAEEGK